MKLSALLLLAALLPPLAAADAPASSVAPAHAEAGAEGRAQDAQNASVQETQKARPSAIFCPFNRADELLPDTLELTLRVPRPQGLSPLTSFLDDEELRHLKATDAAGPLPLRSAFVSPDDPTGASTLTLTFERPTVGDLLKLEGTLQLPMYAGKQKSAPLSCASSFQHEGITFRISRVNNRLTIELDEREAVFVDDLQLITGQKSLGIFDGSFGCSSDGTHSYSFDTETPNDACDLVVTTYTGLCTVPAHISAQLRLPALLNNTASPNNKQSEPKAEPTNGDSAPAAAFLPPQQARLSSLNGPLNRRSGSTSGTFVLRYTVTVPRGMRNLTPFGNEAARKLKIADSIGPIAPAMLRISQLDDSDEISMELYLKRLPVGEQLAITGLMELALSTGEQICEPQSCLRSFRLNGVTFRISHEDGGLRVRLSERDSRRLQSLQLAPPQQSPVSPSSIRHSGTTCCYNFNAAPPFDDHRLLITMYTGLCTLPVRFDTRLRLPAALNDPKSDEDNQEPILPRE